MSNINLSTSDGFKLSTDFNNVPKSNRAIIFAHGMTVNKDDEGIFVRSQKTLNDSNFSTLRFDFRAHGDSSGNPVNDFTISGELTDLDTAVQFLKDQGFNWLGLAGASFGGSIAALLAGFHPDLFQSLILVNPVLDYQTAFLNPITPWAKQHFSKLEQRLNIDGYIKIGSRQFAVGPILFDEMKQFFPSQNLLNYQNPLLIIHGDHDTKISYQTAKVVFRTLTNPHKHFETIKGSDHGFHDEPFETQVTDIISNFFIHTG